MFQSPSLDHDDVIDLFVVFLETILALIALRELVGSCHRMVGTMVEQSWFNV